MIIEQIYTGCLAQGAYYVESDGEALVIDPLREVGPYLERAEKTGSKIKYILETHFHADFVSGHIDLAEKTGGTIVYGPNANPAFKAQIATDNEVLKLGKITIHVLHTPGHTLESTTYLLKDENGKDCCIFTGDTLFLGDVGRPDLAQKLGAITKEDLAGMLYDSLHNKIMVLADDVTVYPGHGAGSACGKNMSKDTVDTLGHQKMVNYALKAETKEAFIKEVTDGLQNPPAYFPQNVNMNKGGYKSFDSIVAKGLTALTAEQFETLVEVDTLILDTRNPAIFQKGFILGAINIGIDGQFAPWVGALIGDVNQKLVLVTEEGREEETITRLSRVGFDNVLGYLKGGMETWVKAENPIEKINRISVEEFARLNANKSLEIIDIRKESEYAPLHIENANNLPLDAINSWFTELSGKKDFAIHCAGGYRSMIAASIMKARGIHDFYEVEGGFGAINSSGLFDLSSETTKTELN